VESWGKRHAARRGYRPSRGAAAYVSPGRKSGVSQPKRELSSRGTTEEYPCLMDDKWLEFANKMAEAARAGLAKDRERLNEIPADRQRSTVCSQANHPLRTKGAPCVPLALAAERRHLLAQDVSPG
jgi:hypothetical protein